MLLCDLAMLNETLRPRQREKNESKKEVMEIREMGGNREARKIAEIGRDRLIERQTAYGRKRK